MSDQPFIENLDLRFLPDWLKEPSAARRAPSPAWDVGGETSGPADRDRSRGGEQRPSRNTPRIDRRRHGSHDPRRQPAAHGKAEDERRGSRAGGFQHRDRRGEQNRGGRRNPSVPREEAGDGVRQPPAPVNAVFTFLPEPQFIESVLPKLKHALITFPLYSLARLFLAEPARHRVLIRKKTPDGPGFVVTRDLSFVAPAGMPPEHLARQIFQRLRDRFYRQEVIETEEIKGIFRSVAVCSLNNEVIGPSNHHSYLPKLKRLYDERFSRRMSFERFRESIVQVSDPEAVEKWKIEARRKIVWHPITARQDAEGVPAPSASCESPAPLQPVAKESAASAPGDSASSPNSPPGEPDSGGVKASASAGNPGGTEEAAVEKADAPSNEAPPPQTESAPVSFNTEDDVFKHFTEKHLPSLIEERESVELDGAGARAALHGPLLAALREAFEAESKFPQSLGRALAEAAQAHGLHVFKLDKKIVCIAPTHPSPVDPDSPALAEGVARILQAARANPGGTRADLARKILGGIEPPDAEQDPEGRATFERKKSEFLKDLKFAVNAGFLFEMNNGAIHLSFRSRQGANDPDEKPVRDAEQQSAPPVQAPDQASKEDNTSL